MTDFGRDISCTTSLRTGRYATGARLVAEAAYRRLTTPRGMLRGGEDEADYGLDLTALVGSAETAEDAASLPGRIQNELDKDERIQSTVVDVVATRAGASVTYDITIAAETAAGPFTLVLAVSAVTVEIVGLTAEA